MVETGINYNRVDVDLTTHADFRELSERAKLVCLFLRATKHNNVLGCFYYPIAHIADDLNIPVKCMEVMFSELGTKQFMLYCKKTRWIFLPKHLKKFPVLGVNRMIAAIKRFETVPHDFVYLPDLAEILNDNHDFLKESDSPRALKLKEAWLELTKGLGTPLRNLGNYTYTDTDTDTYTDTDTDIGLPAANPLSRFDGFWEVWPTGKKKKKPKSKEYWIRDKLDEIADEIINDVINRKCKDSQWKDGFVPNPTTYLNGKGWTDDIDEQGVIKDRGKKTATEKLRDYAESHEGTTINHG